MRSGKLRVRRLGRGRGFTYVAVLIWAALIGIGLAVTGDVWHTTAQREREDELLFIGEEFRRALNSYYESSPGAQRFPLSLAALLKDERYPTVRRHLRKLYVDPMTGKAEWGLVRRPDGGIVAVHSLSTARPLRVANFRASQDEFAGKRRYSEWMFRAEAGGIVIAVPPGGGTGVLVVPPPATLPAPR